MAVGSGVEVAGTGVGTTVGTEVDVAATRVDVGTRVGAGADVTNTATSAAVASLLHAAIARTTNNAEVATVLRNGTGNLFSPIIEKTDAVRSTLRLTLRGVCQWPWQLP